MICRRTFARSRKVILRKDVLRSQQEQESLSNIKNRESSIVDRDESALAAQSKSPQSDNAKFFVATRSSSNSEVSHSFTSDNDWIPPNRPLSGDSSSSYSQFIYPGNKHSAYVDEDWENQVDDEQLKSVIKTEAKVTGRSVQYFDLDKIDLETIDWKNLEEQMKVWDASNHDTDAAESLEQLFEKEEEMLKAHELGDDDGWDDIHDENAENNDSKDRKNTWDDDSILKEILSDKDLFDENDEEAMKIQLQLIAERLRQIRDEKKQNKSMNTKNKDTSVQTTALNTRSSINPSSAVATTTPANIIDDQYLLPPESQSSSPTRSNTSREKSQGPNWLQTRQRKMQSESATWTPTNMMLPSEAAARRKLDSSIPVIPHTLLSSREIVSCLTALGGQDIKVIIPDDKTKLALGWDGLILVTGSSYAHSRVMADAIVKNLRLRDLASKGVVGAMYGVEGGDNEVSSSYRHRKTGGRGLNSKDDGWMIVDCRNFAIHIQDEITRKSIDLEALWSPGERGKEGRRLRQVSSINDEQTDDYVSQTPIPDDYTNSLMALSADIHGLMSNAALKQRKSSIQNSSKGRGKMNNRKISRF